MGNSDSQEGGETQQDDVPRDTQFNNQNIESPLSHENQQTTTQVNQVNQMNQDNQFNQANQTEQQYIVLQQQGEQGGQYIIDQGGIQYQDQQEEQLVNQQQYENPENAQLQINQEYEGNHEYEEIDGNQEYEEMEVNQEYEQEGQENMEEHEVHDNEEMVEGAGQMVQEGYEIDQQGNNQMNQQSISYKINKDGNIYNVNEKSQQYEMTSGDNQYQVKKEYIMTKIEKSNENNQKYPNNNLSPGGEENNLMRKNIRINPKDSLSKEYIQTSGYQQGGRYTQYYSDIPRYMSFQRSTIKNSPKIRSS